LLKNILVKKAKIQNIVQENVFEISHKKRMLGKNNPAYKDGSSHNKRCWRGNDWETLRVEIYKRDNYICQLCSQYGNVVHHIDYDKKNCNPNNLITLCCSCNGKVNFKRDYWTEFFKNKLK